MGGYVDDAIFSPVFFCLFYFLAAAAAAAKVQISKFAPFI